jgi:outer membrane protein TolC
MHRPSTALVAIIAAALSSCAERPAAPPVAATPAQAMPEHPIAAVAAPALGSPLDRREVVATVLAVNPGIAAARAAWRAASALMRVRGSWDDPMLSYSFAPLSIGGDQPFGQQVELSQRLPIGGRLALEREVAAAEADAANADVARVRQRLALMASQAYDDYALAMASLALIERHREVIDQLRGAADARVANGFGSLQDPLRAVADLAELDQQAAALRADRDLAIAALDALLHRPIDEALPPPPDDPPPPAVAEPPTEEAPPATPELARMSAEARAADASARLARRQSWPDLAVTGSYTSMWPSVEHQYMVGLSVSIPLQRERIAAAAAEADAQAESARLMLEHRGIEARTEVQQAARRVAAARERIDIAEHRLEPALEQRLAAARIDLESGRGDLGSALEAQRDLLRARVERRGAEAELARRAAELQLALGLVPVLATRPEAP